jgi:hypothetical protein
MTQRHITIGPEFFAKAFNDYANWHWGIVREFYQNSVDCGAREIKLSIHEEDGKTHLRVENDGTSMTEEILVEKLLALGGSGKNFDGDNTGGFGKAKEILYFCHDSYSIQTGCLRVDGSGATYHLETVSDCVDGTVSTIVIDGDHEYDLLRQAKRWLGFAQIKNVDFYVNGEAFDTDLRKGSARRDLGFGQVYTNKSSEYQMVVRINGMPMFVENTGLNRLVIVELKGDSVEVMTSNRDGLVRPFSTELSNFVTELSVDKRSALKDSRRGPRYTEYRGTKLCHSSTLNVADLVDALDSALIPSVEESRDYPVGGEVAAAAYVAAVDETPADGPVQGISVIDGDAPAEANEGEAFFGSTVDDGHQNKAASIEMASEEDLDHLFGTKSRRQVATLGTNFIMKNETDLKIPRYYDPGSGDLSSYSTKLIRYWGRVMLELHRLFDKEGDFSIGFIFDEGDIGSTEAECEQGDYGLVYYLNPCQIVEQQDSYSKSFKKRFKLTERDRLIMIGCHEFIHATGQDWHDETYANRLTDCAAWVMKHRKRFNWCFK